MKVKEYGYPVKVKCKFCGEYTTLYVNRDDWDLFNSPDRPHIQVIFPYLSAEERELLISGMCPKCWAKLFPPEPDDYNEEEECYE